MKYLILIPAFLILGACVTSEDGVRRAIEKDPKIVFDAIEKNPDQFMDVVNKAAQKAQEQAQERRREALRRSQEWDKKNPKKPRGADERRLTGTAKSTITIVEFADFQCPACAMAHRTLKQVQAKYGDDVQFVFKNMPLDFHKMAMPASLYFEGIRAQDREKARRFYDIVFENQRDLSDGFLKQAAKTVGADMSRLEKDIKSEKIKKLIADDMSEFSEFGFTGTPVIIVNGVAMEGAQPLAEIERVIAETKK